MKDYENMSVEQLTAEYNDIYGAIQNEKLLAFGSQDEAEANMHMDNADWLRRELQHVIMLINQKQGRIGEIDDDNC